jgi:hypothetical protein
MAQSQASSPAAMFYTLFLLLLLAAVATASAAEDSTSILKRTAPILHFGSISSTGSSSEGSSKDAYSTAYLGLQSYISESWREQGKAKVLDITFVYSSPEGLGEEVEVGGTGEASILANLESVRREYSAAKESGVNVNVEVAASFDAYLNEVKEGILGKDLVVDVFVLGDCSGIVKSIEESEKDEVSKIFLCEVKKGSSDGTTADLDRIVQETVVALKNSGEEWRISLALPYDNAASSASSEIASSRRKLDDADAAADDGSSSEQQVYILMTPNILSGILFGFFFIAVAWVGLSCMNDIQAPDYYASKQPLVGREM